MIKHLKKPLLISTLIVLACYWGSQLRTPQPRISSKSALAKLDDLAVDSLDVQFFNEEGKQTHTLKATRIKHIPYQDTYRITSPHLTFTPPNKLHWVIDAEEAIAKERAQEVVLSRHVVLTHAPFEMHSAGRIETEQLTFYPQKNYITTDQPITWTQENNHVFSQGMKAYLDKNRIVLSQAKALYEPTT